MRKGFKDFERFNIIEFNKNGYPTTKSLRQLKKELASEDPKKAINSFYAALQDNYYTEYTRPERVEVRGETIDVLAYHTCGWSGNEEVIGVLKRSWLFDWLLERYDGGGHYYFKTRENLKTPQVNN